MFVDVGREGSVVGDLYLLILSLFFFFFLRLKSALFITTCKRVMERNT